ncbi:MAG TPA: prepilin-type N-terminal cleavage/methylation domain-containing protein [Oligoflexia bacterium]|nr:prepilin-type N-terminal cleavage/methylation domain-containing protein [Oligoflexia bacterium]HMP27926.1 prepilin-type N-terminal cleavage/methylation domain-containing protein [Oligoflexia bacterium]
MIRVNNGFTVLELLVAMACAAILISIAVLSLHSLKQPARNSGDMLAAFMRGMRMRALATSKFIVVSPDSETVAYADTLPACPVGSFTRNSSHNPPEDTFRIANGAYFLETNWWICFNRNGFASQSLIVQISDGNETRNVQISSGGAVRHY